MVTKTVQNEEEKNGKKLLNRETQLKNVNKKKLLNSYKRKKNRTFIINIENDWFFLVIVKNKKSQSPKNISSSE